MGVGKQYLDNSEDDLHAYYVPETPPARDKHIDGHVTLDADVTLDLGHVSGVGAASLSVHGGNLTNRRYETSGYVYENVPYFYPAALRNAFATLRVGF